MENVASILLLAALSLPHIYISILLRRLGTTEKLLQQFLQRAQTCECSIQLPPPTQESPQTNRVKRFLLGLTRQT